MTVQFKQCNTDVTAHSNMTFTFFPIERIQAGPCESRCLRSAPCTFDSSKEYV